SSSSESVFWFSCGVGSSSVAHAESSEVAFASPASAHPPTRAMVRRQTSARRTREDRRAEKRVEAGSEEEGEGIGIPSWCSEPGGRWSRNVVVDRVRPRCRCSFHPDGHIPPPHRRNRRRGQSDRFVTGPIRSCPSPRRRGMKEGEAEQLRRGGRTMRHAEERPQTSGFLSGGTMPGHWTQVLAEMRTNAFTHLRLDEIRAEAAHLLIVAPSPSVAEVCFARRVAEFTDPAGAPGETGPGTMAGAAAAVQGPSVEVLGLDELVPERVPAGTWVFLPHRQDGWTDLEETSERLRRALVRDSSAREVGDRLILIEYGVNLWTWADPPSIGVVPVGYAVEIISWESAWALGPADGVDSASDGDTGSGSARPPIYFGLPPVLRTRRWNS